jgi:mRNA-degrading endonuclease RelE of RelBE toxin-antitoxin system
LGEYYLELDYDNSKNGAGRQNISRTCQLLTIFACEYTIINRGAGRMWNVKIHPRVGKALPALPKPVQEAFGLLLNDLRLNGPFAIKWPNYGKLKGRPNAHHCHLKKGRPTYVSVWWDIKAEKKTIEVTYVGTHEKAPY